MPHPLEYVTTGAILQCSQGTVPMPFKTTPRTSKIAGLVAGNALDKVSLLNIPSFVICQKQTQLAGGTPVPCVPAPLLWQDTYPAKVGGADTLLFRSCINCPLGQGKIEFLTSGQLPIPPELSQEIKETREEADEALKQAELEKNSVGEAGLLEGAIPIWGSGRDLIHSIQTGDKLGMALNAGFLVWDAASVVAGVFSFGTATVAMAGAKAGVRGLIKAGGKVALGAAKKQMASLALKSAALKNGLKNIRPFLAKIPRVCVTACFPAGTPVAVEGGYKNIEELQVGDLVWAWHEETGDLALKPVRQTMVRETDALVELQVGADTVQATPEHPFWANGAWTDAGDLVKGDELLRSDGLTMPVGQVTHRTEQATTVYNVEVADWHTYLVSWWMFVVHNATVCLRKISADLYRKLRKKTPTADIRKLVNKKYVKGMPDHALPTLTIEKAMHADHIVSMDKIAQMRDFEKLTFEQQKAVLNYEKNFVGLSETANTSKGSKSFEEWTEYKKQGIKVDDKFRKKMIAKSKVLEKEIQKHIDDLLKQPPTNP
ncbi:MAG TPA: polymorphic toxin-type HINT domain-containing protein [Hymenobacter sp.]|uniref:polymorphic toxin-type HINT domain-containing protein n=1 Tax=Hymenobacter sp. TaxID=1898978 RepID=UPI002D8099A8|nr:polymorphic toxin-type HINT domain-containing protein [Hymenobacter sp.]HET9505135.1 polymorphic toxin-type HINT domain-containing protein [Hymenobacter sp.]